MNTALPDFLHTGAAAACASVDPELWSSSAPDARRAAVRICATCPLLEPCRDWALTNDELYGTWGGLTSADRAALRGDSDPDEPPCGTERAFRAHRIQREKCAKCETAHAKRRDARRRKRLAEEHAKGGTTTGYEIHRRLKESACERCLAAMQRASEDKRRRRGPRGASRGLSAVGPGAGSGRGVPGAQTGTRAVA